MKREARRQRQEERARQHRETRAKAAFVSVGALVALAFAAMAFRPNGGSPEQSSAATSAAFRRITAQELKPFFDRGEVTLIDVRDVSSYVRGHIPGALQIPRGTDRR